MPILQQLAPKERLVNQQVAVIFSIGLALGWIFCRLGMG